MHHRNKVRFGQLGRDMFDLRFLSKEDAENEILARKHRVYELVRQHGGSSEGWSQEHLELLKTLNDEVATLSEYVEGGHYPLPHPGHPRSRRDALSSEYPAGSWLHTGLQAALGGSGVGAVFTPPEFYRQAIDLLAPQSVALASGIRVIRTERDQLVIPHLLADQAAAWVNEGATIGASDPNAEQVTATPRKLAALTQLTNELINDSDPPVLDVFGQQLLRSLALKFDLGVYEGSGTPPEIRGLRNVAGTQQVSMGTNGGTPTNLDQFADAIGLLEQENATATAIVMHPRTWKTLIKIKEQTGSTKPVLQESAGSAGQGIERSIYGIPVYLSSQLSITETQGTATNASSAYVYEADEVIAVIRQEVQIEVDRSALFQQDSSMVRAIMRADVVVPNPKAVVRIAGLLP